MHRVFLRVFSVLATFALVGAFAGGATAIAASDTAGAVYTQTNKAANAVLVFARAADGSLSAPTSVATGGSGSGTGLGSQGSVTVSADGRWLFVVNAGSDSISSFAIRGHDLSLIGVVPSGGHQPISVTASGGVAYVLNAGTPNISGFSVGASGLAPLAGSTAALPSGSAPAQIQFSRSGNVLIVTEKATSALQTFTVDANGLAHAASTTASNGTTPFGFAVGLRGEIFVTEAAASTASSYIVSDAGTLTTVTASAATNEKAACWAAVTKNGRYLFTANAASDSISTFAVAPGGALSLVATTRLATAAHPLDLAVSESGQNVYVLESNPQRIGAFAIGADGTLTEITGATSPLMGDGGLAAR